MHLTAKMRMICKIPLDATFRDHVNSTYESFLRLAQNLGSRGTSLTDDESISQLQDLYFLLRTGILSVHEIAADKKGSYLCLEIRQGLVQSICELDNRQILSSFNSSGF